MTTFRDPASGFLSLGGFGLALAGVAVLLARAGSDPLLVAGILPYGIGMLACFLTSALHHLVAGDPALEVRLLRLDHGAIYLFIAGAYTPICLWLLPRPGALWLLTGVWAIALAGCVYKLGFAPDPPNVEDPPGALDVGLYVAMGWLAVIELPPLARVAAPGSLALLVLAGLAYTLGGLILAKRLCDFRPGLLGHHEIWHLMVIVGSAAVYGFIYVNMPAAGV